MIKGLNGSELLSGGLVIREPAGLEKGYWVGAPGVFHARDENCFYLTYRIRRPRGIAPDRGGEARIARSTDLNTSRISGPSPKISIIALQSNAAPFARGLMANGVIGPVTLIRWIAAGVSV